MGKSLDEFCEFLNGRVGRGLYVLGGQGESLYVLGGQGESLYGLAREWVLSMEERYSRNPEANTVRVMRLLEEKLPQDLYFYDCSGLGMEWLLGLVWTG